MRKHFLSNKSYLQFEVTVLTSILRIIYLCKHFYFNKKKYKYYISDYNATYSNERMVEIPIAVDLLKENNPKNVLEIGNVLSHYLKSVNHDILDKFEKDKNIRFQKDIVDFKPKKKYDTVISISTIEHVGFDEPSPKYKNPQKIIKSIENIISWKPKLFLFTFPLGWNSKLDEIALNESLSKKFDIDFTFFRRKRGLFHLEWEEVTLNKIQKYHYFKRNERTLVIGKWAAK
jgi:hypothetical protein